MFIVTENNIMLSTEQIKMLRNIGSSIVASYICPSGDGRIIEIANFSSLKEANSIFDELKFALTENCNVSFYKNDYEKLSKKKFLEDEVIENTNYKTAQYHNTIYIVKQ